MNACFLCRHSTPLLANERQAEVCQHRDDVEDAAEQIALRDGLPLRQVPVRFDPSKRSLNMNPQIGLVSRVHTRLHRVW